MKVFTGLKSVTTSSSVPVKDYYIPQINGLVSGIFSKRKLKKHFLAFFKHLGNEKLFVEHQRFSSDIRLVLNRTCILKCIVSKSCSASEK